MGAHSMHPSRSFQRLRLFVSISPLLVSGVLGYQSEKPEQTVITFPASAVGTERKVLEEQLTRFEDQHPNIGVKMQVIPDAANQKHQLFVLWLNARAEQPDVLQLDVIWPPAPLPRPRWQSWS